MDRSDQKAWETPDQDYQDFFASRPDVHSLLKGSVQEMRDRSKAVRKATNNPFDSQGVEVHDSEVPSNSGHLISVRTYRPENCDDVLPGIVVYHGGGWVLGDLSSEQQTAADLARQIKCLVVNVDYRRAPEAPFPAGVEDAWFAFSWLVENAKKLRVNADRIILYGNSAGANFAAAVAQHALTTPDKKVFAQILRVPVVVHHDALPEGMINDSYDTFRHAPILDREAMMQFLKLYAEGEDPKDVRLSPLLGEQKGLGPVLVQVGGMDPLRDQGIAYYERCKEAGVDATIQVYNGVPHGFLLLPFQTTKNANEDMYRFLKQIL